MHISILESRSSGCLFARSAGALDAEAFAGFLYALFELDFFIAGVPVLHDLHAAQFGVSSQELIRTGSVPKHSSLLGLHSGPCAPSADTCFMAPC